MVKVYGAVAIPNTSGEGRPLPRRDDSLPLHPVHEHSKKRAGLDWDTLTPRCKLCDHPSHQLDDTALCPDCGGVAKPTRWDRANRTEPAPAAPKIAAAASSSAPRPRPRAKVTRTSPDDLVITLRAPGITTPQVAALLNDLLTALTREHTPQTSGVVAEPLERPSTVSTTPEPHVAPAPGKGKPAAGATTRRRRLTADEKQRIAALYVEGWTYADLSEKYGFSIPAIAAAVISEGVTPRPRGGNHPKKKNGAHPA